MDRLRLGVRFGGMSLWVGLLVSFSLCGTARASCVCGGDGCLATRTPTASVTSTPTATATPTFTSTPTPTIPQVCQAFLGLPAIAQAPFKLTQGSTQCGGASLMNPPPEPPFSGSIANSSDSNLGNLGLGCLYAGTFPGVAVPDGSVSTLSVVGVNLIPPSVTLGGSAGHGPKDCTLGAGPGHQCVNGSGGLDGMGLCTTDSDCAPFAGLGSCALEANCYFGPPMPVFNGPESACVINSFLTDLCGSVDLVPPQANLATVLSSRVYFNPNGAEPCPRCINGTCDGGDNVGHACTPVGSLETSLDCPPLRFRFFGAITVALPKLTTGRSSVSANNGLFCAGQDSPGAFGVSDARTITEVGVPPLGSTNALGMDLAATFCVPATDTPIDIFGNFPAAGGLSAAGQIDLSSVLP
jgi:hypothetical protein